MMRVPIGRIRYLGGRRPTMRIPDEVLQCVGFVCEFIEGPDGPVFDAEATGFFVNIPSVVKPSYQHVFFVTAKHVAKGLRDRMTVVTINKRDGGIGVLTTMGDRWYLHPDESVDVAVVACVGHEPNTDIRSIPPEMFLTQELMAEKKIGIGDEVYFPGLFAYAPNEKRNVPLVRHGNIAMIPQEPIQIDTGFAEVYLVEARSIGGISGSPVFVRGTKTLTGGDGQFMNGVSGESYLLGLMHGHWDIKESDINSPSPMMDRRGVNIGIGVIVPAVRIMEVINHPELVELRANVDAEIKKLITPTPDRTS